VSAQLAKAPRATAAGQVDLPHDALSQEAAIIALDDFAHELVPWNALKAVVTALKL
jgi:hypothetical protein